MAFISSGLLYTGIKKISKNKEEEFDDENSNFRVDSYNAGVSFGSEREMFAVRSNLKEDRLLHSTLSRLNSEREHSKKSFHILEHKLGCDADNLQRKIRQLKSYLPRDQRARFSLQDQKGKLTRNASAHSHVLSGLSSQRLINQTYRRLYPDQYKSFMEAQACQIPRIRILSPGPVTAPSKLTSTPLHININSEPSSPVSACCIPSSTSSTRDQVSLRRDGRAIRTSASARLCKDQTLSPQYRVEDAFRVDLPVPMALSSRQTQRMQVVYRPLKEDLNLYGLQRINDKMIPCNTKFACMSAGPSIQPTQQLSRVASASNIMTVRHSARSSRS